VEQQQGRKSQQKARAMKISRIFAGTTTLSFVLVFMVSVAAAGQGSEAVAESAPIGHGAAEHEFHRNHFGGFLGASTHTDTEETGFTLGLDYVRQFTPRWAAIGYTELVSGDLERDIILAVGVVFYPTRRLGLVVAPGVELVTKSVEHHGELEMEDESEFLMRLSAAYGFPIGQAAIGPVVFGDWAGNRWTIGYGIGMAAGF
jgi:hypothetical protein